MFLITIDREVPDGLDVHLLLDNYATHKTLAVKNRLLAHPALPPARHPDRLVMAQRGAHKTVHALEADIRTLIATWNPDPKHYLWTRPANEILERLDSCFRTLGNHL